MKTFYLTLILFSLLLALITANAVLVRQTSAQLEGQLLEIAAGKDPDRGIEAVRTLWEKRRTLLYLSVPTGTVKDMDDRLTELEAAIKSKDADGITLAVRLAVNEARRLAFAERFSTENLL